MTAKEFFKVFDRKSWEDIPARANDREFTANELINFAEAYHKKKKQEEALIQMMKDSEDLELYDQESLTWNPFDWDDKNSHPTEYGKYLICRKDGKIHWETWNNSNWAYNHKEIRYWATITNPIFDNKTKET